MLIDGPLPPPLVRRESERLDVIELVSEVLSRHPLQCTDGHVPKQIVVRAETLNDLRDLITAIELDRVLDRVDASAWGWVCEATLGGTRCAAAECDGSECQADTHDAPPKERGKKDMPNRLRQHGGKDSGAAATIPPFLLG